jgi:hypothetical protein
MHFQQPTLSPNTLPLTSNFTDGELVPIPTLPLESIRIASAPPSANAIRVSRRKENACVGVASGA